MWSKLFGKRGSADEAKARPESASDQDIHDVTPLSRGQGVNDVGLTLLRPSLSRIIAANRRDTQHGDGGTSSKYSNRPKKSHNVWSDFLMNGIVGKKPPETADTSNDLRGLNKRRRIVTQTDSPTFTIRARSKIQNWQTRPRSMNIVTRSRSRSRSRGRRVHGSPVNAHRLSVGVRGTPSVTPTDIKPQSETGNGEIGRQLNGSGEEASMTGSVSSASAGRRPRSAASGYRLRPAPSPKLRPDL